MEPIAAIGRRLVAALRDQFAPGFAAQLLQQVQLLVETLGATPQTAFTQLRQILHAAVSIKLPADAANRLAAKTAFNRPMTRVAPRTESSASSTSEC